jgi:hypothetical protein
MKQARRQFYSKRGRGGGRVKKEENWSVKEQVIETAKEINYWGYFWVIVIKKKKNIRVSSTKTKQGNYRIFR